MAPMISQRTTTAEGIFIGTSRTTSACTGDQHRIGEVPESRSGDQRSWNAALDIKVWQCDTSIKTNREGTVQPGGPAEPCRHYDAVRRRWTRPSARWGSRALGRPREPDPGRRTDTEHTGPEPPRPGAPDDRSDHATMALS